MKERLEPVSVMKYILVTALFFLLNVLVIFNSGALCMGEKPPELPALLPDTLDGWKSAPDDQTYDRNNLHDYINGGAELFLSFGFNEMISRTFSRVDQPEIIVDIFDMKTSRDAFGVFSHSRETMESTFGQGSQYTSGQLLFWKNIYYVSILASPETDESRKAVSKLAKHIDSTIPGEGPLPEIISLLPQEFLVRESIRYFHHYIWLNSHYFVAAENILHIDEKTEAVLARYGEQGARHVLLLVKYATQEDARKAHRDFLANYLPEHTELTEHPEQEKHAELMASPVVEIEDGTWTGCRLNGDLLTIVLGAGSEETVLELIKKVENQTDTMAEKAD